MQPLALANLYSAGSLYARAMRNYDRLELPDYQPPASFRPPDYDWPGDAEGRVLMAWILLAQATHREPLYLKQMLQELPLHLNERGYIGAILPEGEFDEQQFSGHGWVLRALCELYLWRPRPETRSMIERMVRGLVLPARGYYARYPSQPEQRVFQGEAIGHKTRHLAGHWYPSTDIGCAFTMLDGASQAYQLLGWPELGELLEEMIASYASIDKVRLSFQTHSTLSSLRGILRYYATVHRASDLELVQNTYALYRNQAITANWANYNWFGRPTWTEPCAVIDSFIVAHQLWQFTGETPYLEDAQRILYNGMAYGQRPNGGYGCDICAGADTPFLAPKADVFEATWCCTMRGGEGLAKALEYSHLVEGDTLWLPYYDTAAAVLPMADGELVLVQRSAYPYSGRVDLEVLRATASQPVALQLYIPAWAEAALTNLTLNGERQMIARAGGFAMLCRVWQAGDRITLDLPMQGRAEPAPSHLVPAGLHSYWHGPLLLGLANQGAPAAFDIDAPLIPLGNACYQVPGSAQVLAPIEDLWQLTWDEALHDRRQVLFAAQPR